MPFPSQAQSSKLSLVWLYYQYKPPPPPPPPPPTWFEPRALKPGQGLPSLTRGFQGRPGASKPEAPIDFKFEMPIPGPWPWPCPKLLKLYSKLKPGDGTALSDFLRFCPEIRVFTDAKELISTWAKQLEKFNNKRIKKMLMDIQHLSLSIFHIPGIKNATADFRSRRPRDSYEAYTEEEVPPS